VLRKRNTYSFRIGDFGFGGRWFPGGDQEQRADSAAGDIEMAVLVDLARTPRG
jgi:hypothetical protein